MYAYILKLGMGWYSLQKQNIYYYALVLQNYHWLLTKVF